MDDHEGRLFLNRFSYYSLVPVIEIGLAIEINEKDPPSVKALDGQVTVLGPHQTCLSCRSVINPEIARAETMRRNDPDEYELRKAEAYVFGEGNPNPAVVTFTTELVIGRRRAISWFRYRSAATRAVRFPPYTLSEKCRWYTRPRR